MPNITKINMRLVCSKIPQCHKAKELSFLIKDWNNTYNSSVILKSHKSKQKFLKILSKSQ